MIACDDRQCRLQGALTVDNAAGLLVQLKPHLERGIGTLDLSAVEQVDSAALALIFSSLRQSRAAGHELRLAGLPANIMTLAELYGVAELLPA
ncbi:MAG: STAS domain-containing protein [Thiobacillus sp.]|jgi:phospholipid transport system transporter-binding protein